MLHPKKRLAVQLAALAIAAACLILGTCRGEAEIVYQKAANLCFECIGLG